MTITNPKILLPSGGLAKEWILQRGGVGTGGSVFKEAIRSPGIVVAFTTKLIWRESCIYEHNTLCLARHPAYRRKMNLSRCTDSSTNTIKKNIYIYIFIEIYFVVVLILLLYLGYFKPLIFECTLSDGTV